MSGQDQGQESKEFIHMETVDKILTTFSHTLSGYPLRITVRRSKRNAEVLVEWDHEPKTLVSWAPASLLRAVLTMIDELPPLPESKP